MKIIIVLTLALSVLILGFSPALADKSKNVPAPETIKQIQKNDPDTKADPQGVPLYLNWYSINSGGASYGTSGSLRLGYSIGQSVAGAGSSGSLNMGAGFWYGQGIFCTAKAGDATGNGSLALSDIVRIIDFLFKAGPAIAPICRGDVNKTGNIALSDIVYLVNFLFKSGPAPIKSGVCCL